MRPSLRVPAEEIQRRIVDLQQALGAMGLQAALIAQRIDLLYFSGCAQNAYLYVPRSGDPLLLVRRHAGRAAQDSPLPVQIPIQSVREIPARIRAITGRSPRLLGLVWDVLPVREFDFLRRLFAARAYVDISEMVHRLRGLKTPWEQARIRESSDLCLETLTHLRTCMSPGMQETALAGLAEAFARQHGHGGGIRVRNSFHDSRSCRLWNETGAIPKTGPFSIGFTAVVNGYHASRARIFTPPSSSGTSPTETEALESIHGRVLQKAGTSASARDMWKDCEMEAKRAVPASPFADIRVSFHGIGLERVEPVMEERESEGPRNDRSLYVAVETFGMSRNGIPLFLQDTIALGGEGLTDL